MDPDRKSTVLGYQACYLVSCFLFTIFVLSVQNIIIHNSEGETSAV